MQISTFTTLIASLTLAVAVAVPNPQDTPTITSSTSTAATATCTATAVSPPPATATCGIFGGETTSGVFPLNYETSTEVADIAGCAEDCLAYSNGLCKSFGVNTETSGTYCILFAYSVEELDVQPQDPEYGPGTEFFDVACYQQAC